MVRLSLDRAGLCCCSAPPAKSTPVLEVPGLRVYSDRDGVRPAHPRSSTNVGTAWLRARRRAVQHEAGARQWHRGGAQRNKTRNLFRQNSALPDSRRPVLFSRPDPPPLESFPRGAAIRRPRRACFLPLLLVTAREPLGGATARACVAPVSRDSASASEARGAGATSPTPLVPDRAAVANVSVHALTQHGQ